LEVIISKLSWLKYWIPPAELKAAVEEARNALGGGKGRPLAPPGPSTVEVPRETTRATNGVVTSLSEEFQRRIARRSAVGSHPAAEDVPAVPVGEDEEEDVPMWSGRDKLDPRAERVLRIFRGTVVKRGTGEY
jgi:hypothetical protein